MRAYRPNENRAYLRNIDMRNLISAITISSLLYSTLSVAEMLQVSADGTVYLSTDSIEVNGKDKLVKGIVFFIENGEKSPAPFSVRCAKSGGTIVFRKGDGSMGETHEWKPNGVSVFDAISITSCKIAGM
jgi:hypothetical protein